MRTNTFSPAERDLLRRELGRHFGQDPLISDGLFLRTWRGGERRGQPKIPPAMQTMLDRACSAWRSPNAGPAPTLPKPGWPPCASWSTTGAPWTPAALRICAKSLG